MKKFSEIVEKNIERLEQYVPVVDRVHGGSHPEFHDVHKLFNQINTKVKETNLDRVKLNEEFSKLRKITSNYTVPSDVCESYEAVYNMMAELDEAYKNQIID